MNVHENSIPGVGIKGQFKRYFAWLDSATLASF
jgi:hypothetical protein